MLPLNKFDRDNVSKLELELLTDQSSLKRRLTSSEILRPSYALHGYTDYISKGRVMLFDNTDLMFLNSLEEERQKLLIDDLIDLKIPCYVFCKSKFPIPKYFIKAAKKKDICIYQSNLKLTKVIHIISDYLDFIFAEIENVHGTLVDVFGIGILFTGRSGIGKSEVALDLVERGHRLVADDLVLCKQKSKFVLMGEGREFAEHFLEIRGIGLVDVKRMFGIKSIRVQKRIEVVVDLVDWDPKMSYERIGIEENFQIINKVKLPKIVLPINPGKNITVLTETIAMNQLLKVYGINPAKEFNERLIKEMRKKVKDKREYDDFLDDDHE